MSVVLRGRLARSPILAFVGALCLVAGACSDIGDEQSSDTTQPLGYPTSAPTTLPESAQVPEVAGSEQATDPQLPAALALIDEPDWSQAGRRSEAPAASVSVLDFGAVADDDRSDSAAFADAVAFSVEAARTGTPTTVEIPAGRFLLTETLPLASSVVLRGEGIGVTFVDLDLGGADIEGITMVGAPFGDGDWIPFASNAVRGDRQILVDDNGLDTGQVIEIEQDNVDEMVSREEWVVDWGQGSSGAVLLVADTGPTSVVTDHQLNDTFTTDRNARLRPITAITRSGIESMTIERLDAGYGHTVSMRFGYDLWVRDVELIKTSRAHIGIDQVGRCEISGSQIHGAHDFGDGGRAYGISIARHATNCLIEDNALWDLRHAMIIQLGANGNVFGYNDARGSAGYEDRQPRADISLHGHWPQANLFEGNVIDRIVFADWWGPVGPANVLWRSCVLDSASIIESSNDQAVVASVAAGLAVDDDITGTLLAANVIDGEPADDSVDLGGASLPRSLYGSGRQPPTDNDCRVDASDSNPWAQPGADRP